MPYILKRYPKGTTLPGTWKGRIYWAHNAEEAMHWIKRAGKEMRYSKEEFEMANKLYEPWVAVRDDIVCVEWGNEENEFGLISP